MAKKVLIISEINDISMSDKGILRLWMYSGDDESFIEMSPNVALKCAEFLAKAQVLIPTDGI